MAVPEVRHGASLIQTGGVVTPGTAVPRQKVALNGEGAEPTATSGLTAFEKDYLTDANNPLDQYYKSMGPGTTDSAQAVSASGATAGVSKDTIGSGGKNGRPAATVNSDNNGVAGTTDNLDAWEKNLVTNERGTSSDADSKEPESAAESDWAWSQSSNADGNDELSTCVTRDDPRAVYLGYTTAPAGSSCIFGLDDRDEGSHCIYDDGSYGSLGWCYTAKDRSAFGSCSESCPLFGPAKILGDKLDSIDSNIKEHFAWERGMASTMSATTTTTTTIEATSTATGAGKTSNATARPKTATTAKNGAGKNASVASKAEKKAAVGPKDIGPTTPGIKASGKNSSAASNQTSTNAAGAKAGASVANATSADANGGKDAAVTDADAAAAAGDQEDVGAEAAAGAK